MAPRHETLTISIDNRPLQVDKGLSILEAASRKNIYIPSLCAHKDLTPFGGCRMCIVEVEGMRGFPTACTTAAEDGMVVRTHTTQIHEIRTEILQLILSEHPCSCLICEENEKCGESTNSIRKAGVTTGCRFCPNDGQCELQEVVTRLGVKEVGYQIYYRNLPVEKEDPFYDRDYNLCILCGRCIRVCQEVRAANTLSFKQRGRHTVIGPAYKRTHLEAGCEFCGACVSVCPTGALSEKTRKWEGKPERETVTTCALCSIGCQLRLLVKGNRVIGSLPGEGLSADNGQLCVKGRFCITELVGNHKRLKRSLAVQNGSTVPISSDEAIELAAEKLSACPADEFTMIVSPNCSNEDLYIAQKFARVAMNSNNIETSTRRSYGDNFDTYSRLMSNPASLYELGKASLILCLGLDTRFGQSVVGVQLRKAIKNGAKLVTVNPRQHNLSLISDIWLRPLPGEKIETLLLLGELTRSGKAKPAPSKEKKKAIKDRDDIVNAAELIRESGNSYIIVGTEFLKYNEFEQILIEVEKIARAVNAGVLLLPSQNNLYGSFLMGTYAELLPGGIPITGKNILNKFKKIWGRQLSNSFFRQGSVTYNRTKKPKVLYLVGVMPADYNSGAEYVISQNIYPPEPTDKIDLILPAGSFTEADGTFINREGQIRFVRKAVEPPGEASPDWQILCKIARKMGKEGFAFSNIVEIHTELSSFIKAFENVDAILSDKIPLTIDPGLFSSRAERQAIRKGNKKYPYLLTTSVDDNIYRGVVINKFVTGLRDLYQVETININPENARKLGIAQGDTVIVSSADFEKTWRAALEPGQLPGTAHVIITQRESIGANPHFVRIRKKDV